MRKESLDAVAGYQGCTQAAGTGNGSGAAPRVVDLINCLL